MWREMRKYNTMCTAISQTITEFVKNPMAKELLDLSPNHFILSQPPQALTNVEVDLQYSPDQAAMLRSVTSKKGYYSEIMWTNMAAGVCEVMVYPANPYDLWMSTSDPEDTKLRASLMVDFAARNRGKSDREVRAAVINHLAHNHPNGAPTQIQAAK
jgi:hypothetical protein